jgi:hypothetical protein
VRLDAYEALSFAPPLVFATLRDRLSDLVEYLPQVDRIETLATNVDGTVTHHRNRWQGAMRQFPSLIRPFVNPDLAAWYDDARWDEKTFICTWKIESAAGQGVLTCEGVTRIEAAGSGSACYLSGDLRIDAAKVPGIPTFLVRKAQAAVETFIVAAIKPSLTGVLSAAQRFLQQSG